MGIWDRTLDLEEAAATLFKMPQGLPAKEYSPGDASCLEDDRILYARWNGVTCTPADAAPMLPEETCDSSFRMKTQVVCMAPTQQTDATIAFTGVPWEPPIVLGTATGDAVAMDGGDVTLTGIGFAASTFLTCATVPPDPAGEQDAVGGMFYFADGTRSYASAENVVLTSATANAGLATSVYHGRADLHFPANADDASWSDAARTRNGAIPPFRDAWAPDYDAPMSVFSGGSTRFPVGYWESVTCAAPAVPFPSDRVYMGVSNDGGVMGSEPMAATFSDFALQLDAAVPVDVDALATATGLLGGDFALSLWTMPAAGATGTLFSLGSSVSMSVGVLTVGSSTASVSSGKWHHVLVSSTGGALTVTMDGTVTRTVTAAAGSLTLGAAAGCLVDEVKLFGTAMTFEAYAAAALLTKEYLPTTTAAMVLRFTNTATPDCLVNSVNGATACGLGLTLAAASAPWEPTLIYTVDGREFTPTDLYSSARGATETWTITGFNLAPSAWLNCEFGTATEVTTGYGAGAFPSTASDMQAYPLYALDGSASFAATTISDTEVTCPVATTVAGAQTQGYSFGVTNAGATATVGMSSYTDLSLQCDGVSSYATNAAAAALVAGRPTQETYTLALWVYPTSADASAGTTTVLAIEELTSAIQYVQKAMVLYDGEKLFYYDDCVQEVVIPGATHNADEWHYVQITTHPDESATLTVDLQSANFSSASRPSAASTLTLCADYEQVEGAWTPGSFFAGLVDEVMLFKTEHAVADVKCGQSATPAGLVSYANFNAGSDGVGPAWTLQNADVAASTAPWWPANVMSVGAVDEERAGGAVVTVYGTNLAPGPNMALVMDGELLPFGEYMSASGPGFVGVAPPSTLAGCGVGTYTVTAVNCVVPGKEPVLGASFQMESEDAMGDMYSGLVGYFSMAGDAADMDHFEGQATSLPAAVDVGSLDLVPGHPVTVAMWLHVAAQGPAALLPVADAWKLVTYVAPAEGEATVMVNAEAADAVTAALYATHFEALLATGVVMDGLTGAVADVRVFQRALTACDVGQLFATREFGLDVSKSAVAPSASVSVPADLSFTVEAWVFPHATSDYQTLFSIAGEMNGTVQGPTMWAMGLHRSYLSLEMSAPCSVEPCSSFLEAHGAIVLPDRWSHVAVSFSGQHAFFYVDGCFKSFVTYSGAPPTGGGRKQVQLRIGDEATQGEYLELFYEPVESRPFDGIVYDVRVTDGVKSHEDVAADAACAPRAAQESEWYAHLNEGAASTAAGGAVTVPSHNLWTNATSDAPTDLSLTKIQGTGGSIGFPDGADAYVVTSYSACGKQRMAGGDGYTVTMVHTEDASATMDATVVDTDDGNYHVSYADVRASLRCGAYTSVLSSGAEVVAAWTTSIAPGASVRTAATVQGATTAGVDGVHRVTVQTTDATGCAANSTEEVYVVSITGPESLTMVAVPGPRMGQYTVPWVPRAPGSYHVTVQMTSGDDVGPVGDVLCVEVSAGHTFTFSGADALVVADETAGADLDLSGLAAFTLEAWVSLDSVADGYLLVKADPGLVEDQLSSGADFKGYSLKYDAAAGAFVASVYVGYAEHRTVSIPASVSSGTWVHVAAVYTGSAWEGFVDGVSVATAAFDSSLPAHANPYYHPLSLGVGLQGQLDDVIVWAEARTTFASWGECGLLATGSPVASMLAYFSFNDEVTADGSVTGVSAACAASPAADCLRAAYFGGDAASLASSRGAIAGPLLASSKLQAPDLSTAVGEAPSSMVAGSPAAPMFTVSFLDQCGYVYTGDGDGLVVDATATGPATVSAGLALVPKACPAGGERDATYRLGNTFDGSLPLTVAGEYTLAVTAGATLVPFPSAAVNVTAAAPVAFAVSAPAAQTAGEDATFSVSMLDEYGNVVTEPLHIFALTFTLVAEYYGKAQTLYATDAASWTDGVYVFDVNLCRAGTYVLDVVSEMGYDLPPVSQAVTVASGGWQKMSEDETSVGRFQAAGVTYDGDLYVFGGALADKSYSNELLKSTAGGASDLWEPVQVAAGVPPSPRYAHSTVLDGDVMYVFGGQRSLYAFNEVHTFNLTTSTWSFVSPATAEAPAPRYDHAAAIVDGQMIVYGGRGTTTKFLADMWSLDLTTLVWTLLANETVAGARFGHSMVSPPQSAFVYVFGGYSDVGLSNSFYMCDASDGSCVDISYGCSPHAIHQPGFQPARLTPRFGHTSQADSEFVVIYGGTDLTEPVGFSDVFMFNHKDCAWDTVPVAGEPLGLYDHTAWLTDKGLYVQGGKDDGVMKDTYFLHVC